MLKNLAWQFAIVVIVLFLVLLGSYTAQAQVIPAQNQVTSAPYGGLVYATSSSATAKLYQLLGSAFGNVPLWDGTKWTAAATSTLGLQSPITLTTVGTSGAATFIANVLNIPNYTSSGSTGLATTTPWTIGQIAQVFSDGAVNSIATSSLNIAISDTVGTLTVARGGTGNTTFSAGQLLYGNGTNALSSVATSSIALGTGLSYSGTLGSFVGGANGTLSLSGVAPGSIALPKGNFLVGNDAGVAQATSTVFISSTGQIGIGTTTPSTALQIAQNVASSLSRGQLHLSGVTDPLKSLDIGVDTTNNRGFIAAGRIGVAAYPIIINPFGGNIAIGTTSPTSLLNIAASDSGTTLTAASASMLDITNRSTTDNSFGDVSFSTVDTAGATVTTSKIAGVNTVHTAGATSGDLSFLTRSAGTISEKMRILANGNVGIASTTPAARFAVTSSAANDGFYLMGTNSAANSVFRMLNDTGQWTQFFVARSGSGGDAGKFVITVGSGATNGMVIDTTGRVGFGTNSPLSKVGIVGSTAIGATYGTLAAPTSGLIVEGNVGIGTSTPSRLFSVGGDVVIGAPTTGGTNGNLFLNQIATPAGAFLAVNPSGQVIATSTPTGTNFFTNSAANTYLSTGVRLGIGTTSPYASLSVATTTIMTSTTSTYDTPGTFTYSPPAGVVYYRVYAWGAGGGAGSSAGGGGAGAGAYISKVFSIATTSVNVVVGQGGRGGVSGTPGAGGTGYRAGGAGEPATQAGGGGGSSQAFGTTIIACAGGGGADGSGANGPGGLGASGTSGGQGGSVVGGVGGGGGCATVGAAGSGSTGGAGGTGGSAANGTNGTGGLGGASNEGAGGGSSAGITGNGATGTAGGSGRTGASGSGGAAAGAAGTGFDSGGGGTGGTSGNVGQNGGAPGSGGGGGSSAQAGHGGDGKVIIIAYTYTDPIFLVVNASSTAIIAHSSGEVSIGTSTPVGAQFAVTNYASPFITLVQGLISNVLYVFETIDEFGHLFTGGPAPTANSCTGFSVTGVADDRTGTVTMTSGTSCSINFAKTWSTTPVCMVAPGAASTIAVTPTTSGVTFTFGSNQTTFRYICQAHQ